jgi:hypothetical protein
MIAAIVAPFGWYSIFSTTDCLDDEDAAGFDGAAFEATALVSVREQVESSESFVIQM